VDVSTKFSGMKTINSSKIWRLILPSMFFIAIAVVYVLEFPILSRYMIVGSIVLPILVNLFLQNIIISRVLGVIFLLGSYYMMLAVISDVVNRKASFGYIFGALIILFSVAMAALLIVGYNKNRTNKR